METLTFTCKIITPMFLAGADGQTPELRAASIKGALRFWWRACNGHLKLDSEVWRNRDKKDDVRLVFPGLRGQETAIFGGVGEKESDGEGLRSSFTLRVRESKKLETKTGDVLVPHKTSGYTANSIVPGQIFEVIVQIPNDYKIERQLHEAHSGRETNKLQVFSTDKLIALFQLTCMLGGLGRRVRRGMGSIHLEKIDYKGTSQPILPATLEGIQQLLSRLSPHFSIDTYRNVIQNVYSGRMEPYPWIQQIEVGKPNSNILKDISQATHDLKAQYSQKYEPNMGHSFKGRFASPVFVSVVSPNIPIITTLNVVPDRDKYRLDLSLQNAFRKRIIK